MKWRENQQGGAEGREGRTGWWEASPGRRACRAPSRTASALRRLPPSATAYPAVTETTTALIASLRATDEAREGMAAFLEKRPPVWREDQL